MRHPGLMACGLLALAAARPLADPSADPSLAYARTELFFGTARPAGVVSEEEFRGFVDREVAPHFPEGLTLLKGGGQYRAGGHMIKEQSFVLVLLYPSEKREEAGERIQHIRALYKQRFEQQSVLRVDDPYLVWVSF